MVRQAAKRASKRGVWLGVCFGLQAGAWRRRACRLGAEGAFGFSVFVPSQAGPGGTASLAAMMMTGLRPFVFGRRAEKKNHHPSPPSGEYARATKRNLGSEHPS